MGRKSLAYLLGIVWIIAALPGLTLAQEGEGQGGGHGWGPRSDYGRLFDPGTVETITGEVREVAHFNPPHAKGRGVHLLLDTTDGEIAIHLGPEWFITEQDFAFRPKDKVSVTGSRVTFNGRPAMIAAEIEKGGAALILRDDDGIPLWSASRDQQLRMHRGPRGWGRGSAFERLYDPATVETLTGKVVEIGYFSPANSLGRGVHLTLKTQRETIPVHLGPSWFVENQDLHIQPNDSVSVHGSRITVNGEFVVIAAEVQRGEDLLQLRDANGIPRWSGWRRARGSW